MTRLILLLASTFLMLVPAAAQQVSREITNVAGDVYLFRNNNHNSLVVVTTEGVVRVDPINSDAGAWLNENLKAITDQTVSHLIYSHSHLDHASGGSAHPDAIKISHQNAPAEIDGTQPSVRIGDAHKLEVGNKVIELKYLGPGHGNDMLAAIVRPENVAFIVDVAAPKRLPFRNFGGANVDDWIDQIKTAQGLEFDIFAPGHGMVGSPADLDDALIYMEELKAGVMAGLKAGKSVDEIITALPLDRYSAWDQFDAFRPLNIQGMAGHLQATGQIN